MCIYIYIYVAGSFGCYVAWVRELWVLCVLGEGALGAMWPGRKIAKTARGSFRCYVAWDASFGDVEGALGAMWPDRPHST